MTEPTTTKKLFFWKRTEDDTSVTYVFFSRIILYLLPIAYLAAYYGGIMSDLVREIGLTVVLAYALVSFISHSKPWKEIAEAEKDDPSRITRSGIRFSFTNPLTVSIRKVAAPAED